MARSTREAKSCALERILGREMNMPDAQIDLEESDKEEHLSDIEEAELEVALSDASDGSSSSCSRPESPEPAAQAEAVGHRYVSPSGQAWSTNPPARCGQRPAGNILRLRPGITQFATARLHDEESAFKLLFDADMVDTIVVETNREATRVLGQAWLPTTRVEMYGYIGLCFLRGVFKGNMESIEELWSADCGRKIFAETMSLSRFKSLLRFLRFDNRETRAARLQRDKLAAVRLLLDGLVSNSQRSYVPSGAVTVDEQLFPYRGRCRYIQYMPMKPAKYGLKFWCLNDAANAYCWNLQMYVGREEDREVSLGEHVVLRLAEGLRGSGMGITVDNFFCSLSLARRLQRWNLTLLGSMRSHRREVPLQMRSCRNRQLHSTEFVYTEEDKIQLAAYKAKPNKLVLILSSQHSSPAVSAHPAQKPQVILDYNATKGGTDLMDQMTSCYSTKYKSRRWHVPVFCNLLNIAGLNSFLLHQTVFPNRFANAPHRRRLYLVALGRALTQPLRYQVEAGRNPPATVPVHGVQRGRCHMCGRSKDRKTRTRCTHCDRFCCAEHLQEICLACTGDMPE
ncbi:hypothetical protein BOX15_Mlig004292g1 [Macrostomum lignano]|uniref:PiggyBac transposable element-derived protein domain-containing protein n=1 Tax=Macrostomum lignano TaxID=282301 RepID=A0A267DYR7_9PLAT|nr:hypothetical protein BOX15_Mlig004292g1 [Macrostomum lignano]